MHRSTHHVPFAVSALFLACAANPPPVATADEEPDRPEPVEFQSQRYGRGVETTTDVAAAASFETSASTVAPGRTFLVAAHFKISDGYKLSWINPGDKGKEPTIEFRAPEGFTVSGPMFPGPNKYELSDGYVSYGYEGETAVFAKITTPENVGPDEVYRFELSAKWLACKTTCLREGTEAYFELVGSETSSDEGGDQLLPHFLERIPQPLASVDGASAEWRDNGSLVIRADGVTWKDFFPARADQPALSNMSVDPGTSELLLHFSDAPAGGDVRGVLLAEIDGKIRYLEVDARRP